MSPGAYWFTAGLVAATAIVAILVARDMKRDDDDPAVTFEHDTRIVIASLFLVGSVVWPLLGLMCLGLAGRELFRTIRTAWRNTNRGI